MTNKNDIPRLIKAAETDVRKTMMVVALTGLVLSATRGEENMHRDDIDYAVGIVDVLVKITSEMQVLVDQLEVSFKAAQELIANPDKGTN
jgi:hypothetical protein